MSIEYLASAVIVVSFNPSVGPYQELRYFFLLSVCTDQILSAPKIITFLLLSPFIEKFERASNLIY